MTHCKKRIFVKAQIDVTFQRKGFPTIFYSEPREG